MLSATIFVQGFMTISDKEYVVALVRVYRKGRELETFTQYKEWPCAPQDMILDVMQRTKVSKVAVQLPLMMEDLGTEDPADIFSRTSNLTALWN